MRLIASDTRRFAPTAPDDPVVAFVAGGTVADEFDVEAVAAGIDDRLLAAAWAVIVLGVTRFEKGAARIDLAVDLDGDTTAMPR